MNAEWVPVSEYAGLCPDDFDINTYTAPLRVWCHQCKVSHEALDWPVTCRPHWMQPH